MVWIVELDRPGQCEVDIFVWDTERNALYAAAADILDCVRDWDLSDYDAHERATDINNAVACGDYRNAIQLYNDWESEQNQEYSQYFSVYERDIQTSRITPTLMLIPDLDSEEEEDEEDDDCEEENEPFEAAHPGATCRGPCNNYNPDAYADKYDGTYCCYQCRMLSQVFGGKIP